MKVLAIETSMGRTSLALAKGQQQEPMLTKRLQSHHGQAERLIPLIGELMAEAQMPFEALDRIAVSIGPGGFSGIRTGVAAARGIGLAAGLPVVGATSFRIMAAAFEEFGDCPETYGLAAPAGVHSVYCQLMRKGMEELTNILVLPPGECAAFFAGKAAALTGPAASRLVNEGYVSLPLKAPGVFPDAVPLARLAGGLDPKRDLPSPYYVRPPDARPQDSHLIARKEA